MGLREIFRLEESTERLARGIYNFLFRVAVFSIAILTLVGVGIGVSFVVIQGGVLIGLDAKTQDYLKAGSGVLYVLLVIGSFLFALGDLAQLLWYYFFRGVGSDDRE